VKLSIDDVKLPSIVMKLHIDVSKLPNAGLMISNIVSDECSHGKTMAEAGEWGRGGRGDHHGIAPELPLSAPPAKRGGRRSTIIRFSKSPSGESPAGS
jgi:hypothetical protein